MTKSLHRPKLAALPASGEPTWRLLETSQGRRSHRLDEKMQTMSSLAKTEDSDENKGDAGATDLAPTLEIVASERLGLSFLSCTQREASEWLSDCSTPTICSTTPEIPVLSQKKANCRVSLKG